MKKPPIHDLLLRGPVIPVVTLADAGDAVALAEALLAGGISTIEITLRTRDALEGVRAIARSGLPIAIGVGTCLRKEHLEAAAACGADFAVSPGATDALLAAAEQTGLPLLPGAATSAEVMRLAEAGYTCMKLFPAENVGGLGLLRAWQPVFQDIRFCPTGGITPANAPQYLSLANVPCVGGSWLAPKALLETRDFAAISRLAAEARSLKPQPSH